MKDSRLAIMLVASLVSMALVLALKPALVTTVIYKVTLVLFGALSFFWLDRLAFPYSRPDGYLIKQWTSQRKAGFIEGAANFRVAPGYELVFALSFIRRAVMMSIGGSLGISLGL